jgi:putative redox protein
VGSTTIQWINKGQFVATDSSKHSVVLSTQDAENGTGMKPTDLLLAALGACTAVDIVGILLKKKQRLTGLEIQVTGEQDADPPWAFRKIHVVYNIPGHGLAEKSVADAVQLAENKYCSVKATLDQAVAIDSVYHIVDDE